MRCGFGKNFMTATKVTFTLAKENQEPGQAILILHGEYDLEPLLESLKQEGVLSRQFSEAGFNVDPTSVTAEHITDAEATMLTENPKNRRL